ncbi:MAG: alpha-E domain-containing protein [Microbacteriaceae bacterium]|jgi:uncharacterized alpha-E superfamily protein|nr:alpha-E domain-containing protein [Microbacteriaceae bacterium]
MLSRIAESLFWIGRYVERADGTARILDVYLQLLLEDPWIDEDSACHALLAVMGDDVDAASPLTRADVFATLAADQSHPASIASSLRSARENGRRAREVINTELWECLNATKVHMPRHLSIERAHDFFTWARERAALAVGITESSSNRDDAFLFFTLGRSLERADMTARLLATRTLTEASGPSWTAILRSVGAYEAFLRTYQGSPALARAAEFLLLDRLFPRSIQFSVNRALECLRQLSPVQSRVGVPGGARRALGRISSELEYRGVEEILDDLPAQMQHLQAALNEASIAIRQRYFPTNPMPSWVGGAAT